MLDPDIIFKSDKPFVSTETIIEVDKAAPRRAVLSLSNKSVAATYDTNDYSFDNTQLPEEDIVNKYTLTNLEPGFVTGMNSTLGNHADNVRSRLWKNLNDKLASNPLINSMKALGNMEYKNAYNGIQTVARGAIAKAEDYTSTIAKILDTLNPIQNQTVFDYFTTKDADPALLSVTPIQRNAIIKAKDAIRTLGKVMYEAGLVSKESYEANDDAYLHIVYLKYIDQYRGSGKKTSLLSYLKKRKDKTPREQLALGMIKDVKFLVPETLGTIARDQVLLEMFSNISKMSKDNNLHWVIHKNSKVAIPGLGKTRVDIDDAYKKLHEWEFMIDAHLRGESQRFGTDTPSIDWLKDNHLKLKDKLESIENEALQDAYKAANPSVLNPDPAEVNKFLLDQYVRMPNKPQLGSLRNKWARKEIANDLDSLTAAYTFGDKENSLDKFFSRGGTLERVNQLWKMSMVALNPGSWFRNLAGNFALLDLSTKTNKLTLMSMLHEEVSGALSNQSKYWKLASDYGLFGATWSAVELQDFNNRYGDDLKRSRLEFEQRQGSAIDKKLHFIDERFMSMGRMMAHTVGAKTSKMYALMEGAFKTVAFRDYVEIWEKQSGRKVDSLTHEDQQVVYAKAAIHANDSIFDYSQVNSLVKTLRRIPFGSPFITFSYKAGPAALKAMINNPIKFAEYATLPALLTMVAMAANDWDDEDITQFKKALPEYYRTNPGVAFLPFKDKFDRVQILPLDYVIPWSQYSSTGRKVYENFIQDSGDSPITTSIKSIGTVANQFGFLGGPTPTALTAMLAGKDSFTGRDIVTPGANASQQLGESMLFAYNMIAPAWLSSHGWFAKMADAFGINDKGTPTTNRYGDIKYSPAQAISDITGFRPVGIDQRAGISNAKLGYEKRMREIATYKSKTIKDRNLSHEDRAIKMREANDRMKLLRKLKQENT